LPYEVLVRPRIRAPGRAPRLNGGVEVFYTGPAAFDSYVKSELVKWTGLIKEVGIQPE